MNFTITQSLAVPFRNLYLRHFNWTNIATTRSFSKCQRCCTFKGVEDRFNGITVDSAEEKCDKTSLNNKLQESLSKWSKDGRRCIWFKIAIQDSFFVPILADKGFNFHHARTGYVMMYKWLPTDSEANLPPSSHTNLGVGALVLNKNEQILAVSEKHIEYPHWKLPGGYVEPGENITAAAQREVREETGVESEFESLITFRHTHNMMFGNSDIYILLLMRAITEKITISQREVKGCKWMDVDEYVNHPHVHKWNRFVVNKALDYRSKKLRFNIKNETVKWGPYERNMNYLVVENLK